ncbi:hypothetical protein [Polynucleobacter brandtiae]|uniref:hypothetical protein n=1 Tax=Polynucleobacter brandtiae TaxID=1938816 RepID=UPI0012FE5D51|nr:hypothetical protein [Polynucleobacter brandtiae]
MNKEIRGLIALSFLFASVLGNHWIGFAHGISHSGIVQEKAVISYADQSPTLGHSSAACHLLDALTLAGFIAADHRLPIGLSSSFVVVEPLEIPNFARSPVGLYQTRAPPTLT